VKCKSRYYRSTDLACFGAFPLVQTPPPGGSCSVLKQLQRCSWSTDPSDIDLVVLRSDHDFKGGAPPVRVQCLIEAASAALVSFRYSHSSSRLCRIMMNTVAFFSRSRECRTGQREFFG
jgi:hypothetical protein